MRDVNLTLIQTFFVVAREGSYSAASRVLGMSYQSAANQVRRLEQALGEPLVVAEQGAKTVRLTPRGRSLFRLLSPELETMLSRLALLLDRERPVLRVGVTQAIFAYLLPPVLEAFRAHHPAVQVEAYERDTVLDDLVRSGGIDVCICERFFGDAGIAQHRVGSYALALVHPADWPGLDGADLAAWARTRPFVTYEPGQVLRELALDLVRGDAPVPVALSASSTSGILRCVEAGLGYAIIAAWCCASPDERVRAIVLEGPPRIPVYFGEAAFMRAHPLVADLRRLFLAIAGPRLDGDLRPGTG